MTTKNPRWFQPLGHSNFFIPEKIDRIPVEDLEPGVYAIQQSQELGLFFKRLAIKTDDLLVMTDPRADKLRAQVRSFWDAGELYHDYGFIHKRGVLLHGAPGSGKTCLLNQFMQEHVTNGGYVLLVGESDHPLKLKQAVELIQSKQPGALVIFVFEDIEEYIDHMGEACLLAFLDGEHSPDGALFIATTNYLKKLPKRIICRPRRFDVVQHVHMPGPEVREQYFVRKLRLNQHEVGPWVEESKGFSFAGMADLVISVKCLGMTLEESAKTIRRVLELDDKDAEPHVPQAPTKPIPMPPDPVPAPANDPFSYDKTLTAPGLLDVLNQLRGDGPATDTAGGVVAN
jgi:hypothetical protein